MPRCVECSSWTLRENEKMARLGLGVCAHGKKWEYLPAEFERECSKFSGDVAVKVVARREWLGKKGSGS
jgi:hypothetical protein